MAVASISVWSSKLFTLFIVFDSNFYTTDDAMQLRMTDLCQLEKDSSITECTVTGECSYGIENRHHAVSNQPLTGNEYTDEKSIMSV